MYFAWVLLFFRYNCQQVENRIIMEARWPSCVDGNQCCKAICNYNCCECMFTVATCQFTLQIIIATKLNINCWGSCGEYCAIYVIAARSYECILCRNLPTTCRYPNWVLAVTVFIWHIYRPRSSSLTLFMCRNQVLCLSCLSCVTLMRGLRVITWLCTVRMADCSKCIQATCKVKLELIYVYNIM